MNKINPQVINSGIIGLGCLISFSIIGGLKNLISAEAVILQTSLSVLKLGIAAVGFVYIFSKLIIAYKAEKKS